MLNFSTGDDNRTRLVESIAKEYRDKIVAACEKCSGSGRALSGYDTDALSVTTVDCECMNKFRMFLDMLIAGIPPALIFDVIEGRLYERDVVELDLASGEHLKPCKLVEAHVKPYIVNRKKVLARGYSYLFIGTNSTGKTFLACKILHKFLKRGHSGHYIKFRALLKLINKSITEKGKPRAEAEAIYDEIRNVDLLVVDELGKETGSREHIAGEIEELLKDRDAARRPVIAISNYDYSELEETYTSNIIGAFMRNYRALIFDPKNDMRRRVRENWYE